MEAEGWYRDPYRIHEDRWYSAGTPTALVRDAGVEGKDPPPSGPAPGGSLVPADPRGRDLGPDDLRRADDAETGYEPNPDYSERAFEVIPPID